MTTMIDKPLATDDDEFASPAFPPEHYGCPPWCTRNIRVEDENFISHDSADGLPDWPNFRGYRHLAGRWIPYAASGYPLSIYMDLEPGAADRRSRSATRTTTTAGPNSASTRPGRLPAR